MDPECLNRVRCRESNDYSIMKSGDNIDSTLKYPASSLEEAIQGYLMDNPSFDEVVVIVQFPGGISRALKVKSKVVIEEI